MSKTPPDNAVEPRRKVLKGALAASSVVTMGYSGPALASFQCVTSSTIPTNLPGFKTSSPTSDSSWAWLTVQVYNTTSTDASNVWKAVKVPTGSDPSVTDGDEYFFLDSSNPVLARPGDPVPATSVTGSVTVPEDIVVGTEDGNRVAFVIIYFETDGSIAGFHPTYVQSGSGYPAQGSCLTSLNPNLDQTNISYGG